MIASMIDGRMRIRNSKLKEGVFAGELKRHLSAARGLKEILINLRVGSALLVYDASITSAERIIKLIGRLLDVTQDTEVPKRPVKRFSLNRVNTRKAINFGLPASLAASIIALVAGSKTLHAAFGLAFLGIAGIHFFRNRQILFA